MIDPDHERGGGEVPATASAPRSGFGLLTVALSVAGTALLVLMAIAVNADILGRELLNFPVPGVTEFLGLSIVAVVLLHMANTAREERHISNDLILSSVANRAPRFARFVYGVFNLAGAAIFALIVWYVIPIFQENYQGNYYKGTAGYVEIPVWPFVGIVLVGAITAAIQYVLLAMRDFSRAFGER